jgi:hypothetical protein
MDMTAVQCELKRPEVRPTGKQRKFPGDGEKYYQQADAVPNCYGFKFLFVRSANFPLDRSHTYY